ncbi:hypothetical protein HYV83_02725 [Candidatus Woesearchaeota archaeon]|nr:hypothetical protein [Candidatus Woesearchaeota archaeon]
MVKMAIYRAKIRASAAKAGKRGHGHKESVHCIVKRGSNVCEGYDERKVYGSAYAACYVVLMNERECERISSSVAKSVTKLVHAKKEIASKDIARHIVKELKKRNPHAAFMYETHRDLA